MDGALVISMMAFGVAMWALHRTDRLFHELQDLSDEFVELEDRVE